MIIERKIESHFKNLAKQYRIVTLTGPRQSGKTTLCKKLFPDKKYFSLEDPDTRAFSLSDPRGFLNSIEDGGAILDEIQRAPDLLSYLQTRVDASKKKGEFILTGSNQLHLNEKVTQSLAGRTALLTLLPFSMSEIKKRVKSQSLETTLFNGFYPGRYEDNLDPTIFYKNYYQTYVERDVRLLINIKDHLLFEKFVKLCAGRVGQILDYSSLSNDVGVSVPTIKNWLSVLEASYIVFRLPPYYDKFNKRMIKSPKLYFYDVGLLVYLLDVRRESELNSSPFRGPLFENLVICEFMKNNLSTGIDQALYYMRDSNGNEVDLVFKDDEKINLLEIKSGMTLNSDFLKSVTLYQNLFLQKKISCKTSIIYSGDEHIDYKGSTIKNYKNLF